MKSLGARFARCVNRVYRRTGRVLATRFHHVAKRTPTEVRNALAYVLLNARKHYRERRGRKPPGVLAGASSGLWFDGWKGAVAAAVGEVPGRVPALRGCCGADVAAGDGVAADRAGGSGGGARELAAASDRCGLVLGSVRWMANSDLCGERANLAIRRFCERFRIRQWTTPRA